MLKKLLTAAIVSGLIVSSAYGAGRCQIDFYNKSVYPAVITVESKDGTIHTVTIPKLESHSFQNLDCKNIYSIDLTGQISELEKPANYHYMRNPHAFDESKLIIVYPIDFQQEGAPNIAPD